MELVFLGTSSAVPTPLRNHSSIALKAFGEIMLFDCGEGTQRQMTNIKLSPMKVDRIFITHLHGDHFLGLPGMIQSMAFRGRKNPLFIFGPEGTKKLVQSIKNLGYYALSFPIICKEIKEGIVMDEDQFKIYCCPMQHSVLNLAYKIEEKRSPKFLKEKALELGLKPGPDFGKLQRGIPVKIGHKTIQPEEVLGEERKGRIIVYSGDTRPCIELIDFAEGADVLIHDSTFDGDQEKKAHETGHSTSKGAAKIALQAQVKQLILTHLSTRYRDATALEEEASQIFKRVKTAEDYMIWQVKRDGN